MPELTPELTTEHRLSVIETDIKYLTSGQDKLLKMVSDLHNASCDGNCDVGKTVAGLSSDVSTYKKWTWTSLAVVIAAAIKSVWPC